jgi:glucose/arabinose dehydrogenase
MEEDIMKLASRFLGLLLFVSLIIAPTIATGQFTIVLSGLQNPRGLTFGPGGRLYVAQAGAGGGTATGKITEIRYPWQANPTARDVVTGLISVTTPEGDSISVAGLSTIGNGTIYAAMESATPEVGFPSLLGHLLKVSQGGQIRDVSNVGDFDYAWTVAHHDLAPRDFPDSNPYGVLALPAHLYVANAASNTLDLVHPNGKEEILAFFPNNKIADATPTCIAQGPDGALYIGTLALVDSLVFGPSAIVYRVDPSQANPEDLSTVLSLATPWATGLWPINGCAFGPDGSFYASELITSSSFSGGEVVKIPFDSPSDHIPLTGNALTFPAGVAVGPDGKVYVSNGTAFVPQGQVVRLMNH